jgi:hypothetical protein
MQLPAHLQGATQRNLTQRAMQCVPGAMPPHISIGGNRFTLVDAAGGRRPLETMYLDCCIVDMGDTMAKLYYAHDYEPGSVDPPTCFSVDGVTPSNEASERQARTCAECEWNKRGSAVSRISGAQIKACRDEIWTAVLIPGISDMLFQFRVTPGSFKSWRAYSERCNSQGVEMSLLITRIAFDATAGRTGIVTFSPVNFIDQVVTEQRERAITGKATDALVGRGIVALPPAGQSPGLALQGPSVGSGYTLISPQGAPPGTGQGEAQAAPGLPHSSATTPEAPKRGRKPRAAAQSAPAGDAQAAPVAPFRPQPPQQEPAPAFGIAQPQAAPPQVASALDTFFGSQT